MSRKSKKTTKIELKILNEIDKQFTKIMVKIFY